MEHIERAGIHSGDSIAVYPAWNITDEIIEKIIDQSRRMALKMNTLGLVNIQYLIYDNDLYVIEVTRDLPERFLTSAKLQAFRWWIWLRERCWERN